MPVLAVVVIGALAAGAAVWMGKRSPSPRPARTPSGPAGGVGPERARHASSLLNEEQHRAVYGRIATNRPMEAITEYRRFTGRSLRESMVDVQSLAAHPQVYTLPQEQDPGVLPTTPGPDADAQQQAAAPDRVESAPDAPAGDARPVEEAGPGPHAPDGQAPGGERPTSDEEPEPAAPQGADQDAEAVTPQPAEVTDFTIPAEWTAEPAPKDRPFEVEVMRPDGAVRLSSHDLPAWLRDQLAAMVRDGNLESAAVALSTHTELSVPEAFELLRRIQQSRGQ